MKFLGRLIIASILLGFFYGGHGVYVAFRNLEITECTMAEYLRSPIQKEWLKVTDCQLDPLNSYVLEDGLSKRKREYLIPVYEAGDTIRKSTRLLYAIPAKKFGGGTDEETFMELLRLASTTTIDGVIRNDELTTETERSDLLSLENVAGSAKILEADRKPNLLLSGFASLASLSICLAGLVFYVKKKLAHRKELAALVVTVDQETADRMDNLV